MTSGISLLTSSISLHNPTVKEVMSRSLLPIPVQYVMLYVGSIVSIVSGIAMLKGRDWARFLYVLWSAIGFVVGMVTSPMKALMIPGFVFYVIMVIFLFGPKASRYFRGTDAEGGAEGR